MSDETPKGDTPKGAPLKGERIAKAMARAGLCSRREADAYIERGLVLVDGVRLNASDLSGADLSSVALSQVERIEVLRGGGAVRYGDGAVGGIIHVLTRRPRSGPLKGEFEARTASYDTQELRFSASGGAGPLSGRIDVGRLDGDGYRENDEQRRRDTAAELRITPDGVLSFMDLLLRVSRHTDEYKLPCPVSIRPAGISWLFEFTTAKISW
jgi:iron complex outermembrane receptor protein